MRRMTLTPPTPRHLYPLPPVHHPYEVVTHIPAPSLENEGLGSTTSISHFQRLLILENEQFRNINFLGCTGSNFTLTTDEELDIQPIFTKVASLSGASGSTTASNASNAARSVASQRHLWSRSAVVSFSVGSFTMAVQSPDQRALAS